MFFRFNLLTFIFWDLSPESWANSTDVLRAGLLNLANSETEKVYIL
jgi:hypothetical protein